MKRTMLGAAAALLCLASIFTPVFAAEETEEVNPYLGLAMPDFELTTISGETFQLSETLAEKDAVFINMWASWCPPCAYEFPFLEEAYEEFKDDIEVLAVDIDTSEDDEVIRAYAEEKGLTFLMASDTVGLGYYFSAMYIPTSVLIDRFGNVVWMDVGAMPSAQTFRLLFRSVLGEDYTESVPITQTPEGVSEATYQVSFTDEEGKPVTGANVGFCTDEQCFIAAADENGVASYTGEPQKYHLQILTVPEGYTYDNSKEIYFDIQGTPITVVLHKAS